MKKNLLIITLFLFPGLHIAFAQLQECSTITSLKQQMLETGFTDSVDHIKKLNRTFHLNFHVVKDENGETGMDLSNIDPVIGELNTSFEPISVKFKFSEIHAIDNFSYNTIYYNNTDNELIDLSHVPNTINIYLVTKLYDDEGKITCSYTFFPADEKDVVFIQKNCFDAGRLIHLIGHVFNLYHTHEETFGPETADGNNCKNAGDLCCDTRASKNITTLVNEHCEYSADLKDENGQFYYPSARNYMSFAPSNCRCYFSDEQYIRMINAILKLKNYLW